MSPIGFSGSYIRLRQPPGVGCEEVKQISCYWTQAIQSDLHSAIARATAQRGSRLAEELAGAAKKWFKQAWGSAGRAETRFVIDEFTLTLFEVEKEDEPFLRIDVRQGKILPLNP